MQISFCFGNQVSLLLNIIERNLPPPRRCFLFTMFPDQEPGGRGSPPKPLVQILRKGSSSSGILIREHSKYETPPEGGFLSIKYDLDEVIAWGGYDY